MENGGIEDSQITSSSFYPTGESSTSYARLNGPSTWSALKADPNQWIQVDLKKPMDLTKIATQGRNKNDWKASYVTKYSLSYSSDGESFVDYKIDGRLKVGTCQTFN